MARLLRIQYPGAIYHAMARGVERRAIFQDPHDYERFLEELERNKGHVSTFNIAKQSGEDNEVAGSIELMFPGSIDRL